MKTKSLLIALCILNLSVSAATKITEELSETGKDFTDSLDGPYTEHTIYFGPRVDYIHYDEKFYLCDFQELADKDGATIVRIDGDPKSREYGVNPGFFFTYQYIGKKVPLSFTIPKASFQIGFFNAYDGSTQDRRSVGNNEYVVEFEPYRFNKLNFYGTYGMELGYFMDLEKTHIHIVTGLNGRIWYRDLVNSSEVPDGLRVTNVELYHWLTAPIKTEIGFPVSKTFTFGVNLGLKFLLSGRMKYILSLSDNYGNSAKAFANPVTLAHQANFFDKLGICAGLFFQQRLSLRKSIKVSPYFEYFYSGKSNIGEIDFDSNSGYFYEPASKTFLIGLSINFVKHLEISDQSPGNSVD